MSTFSVKNLVSAIRTGIIAENKAGNMGRAFADKISKLADDPKAAQAEIKRIYTESVEAMSADFAKSDDLLVQSFADKPTKSQPYDTFKKAFQRRMESEYGVKCTVTGGSYSVIPDSDDSDDDETDDETETKSESIADNDGFNNDAEMLDHIQIKLDALIGSIVTHAEKIGMDKVHAERECAEALSGYADKLRLASGLAFQNGEWQEVAQ